MKTEKTFVTQQSSSLQRRPRLAITLGDPAGIGIEVVLKALADPSVLAECEVTVVGGYSLLQASYTQLQQQMKQAKQPLANPEQLNILDIPLDTSIEAQITPGVGNAASGAASFAYLEAAIRATLAGEFDAIVTAPIAKSLWKAAGYNYPGQTEVLAQQAKVERFGMLFVARSPYSSWTLRTLLATTHIPLRHVPDTLTPQLMASKLDLLVECLRDDFGIKAPRIAIAGLNPHSGEQGQLGHEEQEWLINWLEGEQQQRSELQLYGPVPPDTLWVKPAHAWYGIDVKNACDAYLALYHDQGLIPVKLLAFDRAVNTTIGLPFIRTSPDHGTAFDIAGQGIADGTSLKAAIGVAIELTNQRLNR